MLTIDFKRGDTFRLQGAYTVDGAAAALPTGIRSQLRDRTGALVCELTVARTDEAGGLYELSCADASEWQPGRMLYGDVQYTDASGNVMSTETYAVNVIKDETHD
jgi:hypothetical protein